MISLLSVNGGAQTENPKVIVEYGETHWLGNWHLNLHRSTFGQRCGLAIEVHSSKVQRLLAEPLNVSRELP